MATPQLSPGVLVREVDLTVGRADNVLDNIGAIAGPFAQGPIDEPVDITTEQELINVFGKPYSVDAHYEYWMSASSYLSYGGVMKVVRSDGEFLNNANAGVGISYSNAVKIKNFDDYNSNWADDLAEYVFAAKNPGTWANSLKVCVIDNLSDQTVGIATTNPEAIGAVVGAAVTVGINSVRAGVGATELFSGYIKGIVTGVTTSALGKSTFDVRIISRVSNSGAETFVDYAERSRTNSFLEGDNVEFFDQSGAYVGIAQTVTNVLDWYDQQTLTLSNTTLYWKSIAPKPTTNNYVLERSGKNDAMHIVIVDDEGKVTGVQGNLLEKHLFISKAFDAVSQINAPQKIWWKNYLANYSSFIYGGDNPSTGVDTYHNTKPVAGGFELNQDGTSSWEAVKEADGSWNQPSQGIIYSSIGNVTYALRGGKDYSGANNEGGMKATLGDLITSYRLFANRDVEVDYLIMGPGLSSKFESQAKANELISLASNRKDCMAVISPHRGDVIDIANSDTQTDNIIEFFSPLSSSSYAIFDTGYKYTYDRFNNLFRYVPCNADVAGLCVRTSIASYPWFSPAGQQRGVLNSAIKLAYNPSKAQRDQLYPKRINSIINQPGVGIVLFGDKTALGYSSAFDRINVRRLFLTVEQALERTAQAQLFELNDEITRANFINIVEPYLREVQAKRGLYGFLVVCDESNNTPDVIDNNEFRADIFLKPAKSINYVTLTFVATRTGVSFEEVVGRV
jgi:hypothetical protein